MKQRARVLFVEQFYYPDGWGGAELPRDLTGHLARSGFHVEVICGSDQYAPVTGEPGEDPRTLGVRILRLRALLKGDVHVHKLLRQLWFYAGLIPKLFFRRPPDLFASQTNPPAAVPMVALAARVWRKPYLLIAMDVYPEVLIAHGTLPAGSAPARFLNWMFRAAYRSARCVVALGPVMARRLIEKGVKEHRVTEISNWSTGKAGIVRGSANRLRSEWGLQENFVLVYSGNLGIGHEFETLLAGFARALQRCPTLRLVVIGKGSRLADVTRLSVELGLRDAVRFSELLPADRLPESIGLADLAVVTLRPGFEGLIVPSKLLGYMSRGVPVLYIGPESDIGDLIGRYRCGIARSTGDVAGVAEAILESQQNPDQLAGMGAAAKAAYDAHLARKHGLARYEAAVRACLASRVESRTG